MGEPALKELLAGAWVCRCARYASKVTVLVTPSLATVKLPIPPCIYFAFIALNYRDALWSFTKLDVFFGYAVDNRLIPRCCALHCVA